MEIKKRPKKLTNLSFITPLDSVIRIGKKTAISLEEDVTVEIPGVSYLSEFNVGGHPCLLILSSGALQDLKSGEAPKIKTVQDLIKTLKTHE